MEGDKQTSNKQVNNEQVCHPRLGCGKPFALTELRTELARQEHRISGLCQSCQDVIFGTAQIVPFPKKQNPR